MSEWVKETAGEYVNGDYRIVRRNINPAYPWEVFRGAVVIELTRTLGEAKSAADADRLERERRMEAKRLDLMRKYAAKFAAESVSAEPARWIEPTNHHLARVLAGCVRPPHEDELYQIREAFLTAYSAGEYGPQLSERRMTYHGGLA